MIKANALSLLSLARYLLIRQRKSRFPYLSSLNSLSPLLAIPRPRHIHTRLSREFFPGHSLSLSPMRIVRNGCARCAIPLEKERGRKDGARPIRDIPCFRVYSARLSAHHFLSIDNEQRRENKPAVVNQAVCCIRWYTRYCARALARARIMLCIYKRVVPRSFLVYL